MFAFLNEEVKNSISIGRRGLFLQGDMHQAIEMGIKAGKLITSDFSAISINNYYKDYIKYIDIF